MRHRVQGRKLGLPSDQRMALLKNQVRQLLQHGHIMTTETRAKEVRRIAERLITRGKNDTLHSRRIARRVVATNVGHRPNGLSGEDYVRRLFEEIAPQFRDRTRGRIPAERVAVAMNSLPPYTVVARHAAEVSPEFHARFDAVSRTYRYYLLRAGPSPFLARYTCPAPQLTDEGVTRIRASLGDL